ncbi:uncharacterized protein BJX67DRAFT_386089 [Aspergillus lucknowensis]|uniref:Peptide hydrolase n=1 Tax=Aspergillus lucknowensis TaxID=176173 RepID=A0ABR4LC80_9EURO
MNSSLPNQSDNGDFQGPGDVSHLNKFLSKEQPKSNHDSSTAVYPPHGRLSTRAGFSPGYQGSRNQRRRLGNHLQPRRRKGPHPLPPQAPPCASSSGPPRNSAYSLTPAELANIRLYLNFDMIASPNYGLLLYDGDGSAFNLTGPPGSDSIEKLFRDYFADQGLGSVETAFNGRSDYKAFILNGIPAGGVFTGVEVLQTEEEAALFGGQAGVAYDENYHQAGDNITNLNHEAFLLNSKATAFAVATYANDLSTIPERKVTNNAIRSVGQHKRIVPPTGRRTAHRHRAGCVHDRVAI